MNEMNTRRESWRKYIMTQNANDSALCITRYHAILTKYSMKNYFIHEIQVYQITDIKFYNLVWKIDGSLLNNKKNKVIFTLSNLTLHLTHNRSTNYTTRNCSYIRRWYNYSGTQILVASRSLRNNLNKIQIWLRKIKKSKKKTVKKWTGQTDHWPCFSYPTHGRVTEVMM